MDLMMKSGKFSEKFEGFTGKPFLVGFPFYTPIITACLFVSAS